MSKVFPSKHKKPAYFFSEELVMKKAEMIEEIVRMVRVQAGECTVKQLRELLGRHGGVDSRLSASEVKVEGKAPKARKAKGSTRKQRGN